MVQWQPLRRIVWTFNGLHWAAPYRTTTIEGPAPTPIPPPPPTTPGDLSAGFGVTPFGTGPFGQ